MRLISTLILTVGLIVGIQSPHLVSEARDAVVNTFTSPASATTSEDQQTYDRICPLVNVWADLDDTGRTATTRTIKRLANEQAKTTEDPALRAFLRVMPEALGSGSSMQTKAAKALIERECTAHNN
jgi:hypothetical protein